MQGGAWKRVVYASDQSHSSIEKAALLAGFGKANLRLIETDKDHALRVDKLLAALREDVAMGKLPCALVACIGTTATTAVDPLKQLSDIAQKYRLWLHVDAAMAGNAMILPECRWMWDGIEAADSIVLNPHKWLGTGFDLSAYYAKDPQHLIRVMGTNPSYLRTAHDDEVKNFRDWGIPLGRRFRSLKLWFLLWDQGVKACTAAQGHRQRGLAERSGDQPRTGDPGAGAPDPLHPPRAQGQERRGPAPRTTWPSPMP